MFQFHSGSIKRNLKKSEYHLPDVFQFHSGSIKSHMQQDYSILFQEVSIP